jgi:CheY-like chemotaxis protein
VRILLIDDDDSKRKQIWDYITSVQTQVQIAEARSWQSGRKNIQAGEHDLVILDMTMPTFDITANEDGGRPLAYAGRDLLRYMKRQGHNIPSLVVTQFDRFGDGHHALTLDELHAELEKENTQNYLGTIHFNVSDESWKIHLKRILDRVSWNL